MSEDFKGEVSQQPVGGAETKKNPVRRNLPPPAPLSAFTSSVSWIQNVLAQPVSLWIHEHAEQVCMFLCLKNLPDAQACLFGLCLHIIVVAVLQLSVTVTPPPPVSSRVETLFILFIFRQGCSCSPKTLANHSDFVWVYIHAPSPVDRSVWYKAGSHLKGKRNLEIKLRTHKEYPHLPPERNKNWLTLKVFTHPHVLSNHMTLCSYFQTFSYMIA